MNYADVQGIAKQTIDFLKSSICAGMRLIELREMAESKMIELGADSFWYWDVGAFLFSGKETTCSVSGKNYRTSDQIVGRNDIITVDLSPQYDKIWGDYARTIVIENGTVINDIGQIGNREWKNGLLFEDRLHRELLSFAEPDTTFEELYFYMNGFISNNGYLNLDFMGNLGHSIATDKKDRIYIEKGNGKTLSSVKYFTFEPHISVKGGSYGYKKEDIYYFNNGSLCIL